MPILDTNLLVHNIRQDNLWQIIENRYALMNASTTPLISIVTEGEIRGLALQFGWGLQKQQRMEDLLGYFTVIPLPFANVVEIWIAATASVTGARLLTTDKDFDHLEGVFLTRDWIDPVL